MDSVDLKLLRILHEDARASLSEMAREVGLSPSGVRKRIQQLERSKLINRYTIVIDPKKYGYSVTAFLKIEAEPSGAKELVGLLSKKHEVCEIHRASGEDTLIVKVRTKNIEDLNRFIESYILSSEFVKGTSATIALKTFKETLLNP